MSGHFSQFNSVAGCDSDAGEKRVAAGLSELQSRHPALQPIVFQSRRGRLETISAQGAGEGSGDISAAADRAGPDVTGSATRPFPDPA